MRLTQQEVQEPRSEGPRIFATTHWSVVLSAGQDSSEPSHHALDALCHTYWRPVYIYVRRRGYGPDDAQDLTQEFFAQLIAKQHLGLADPNKGRFRSFLLAMLHQFLMREWCRAHRQKRGGHYRFVSLDQQMPEELGRFEPADADTPDKHFQRQWTLTVLKQSMRALENECTASGKASLFHEVKHFLSGERDGESYQDIGQRLSMKENTVRVAVHRLRQRYGELLRAEVAQTVSADEEVDEELRYLLRAVNE